MAGRLFTLILAFFLVTHATGSTADDRLQKPEKPSEPEVRDPDLNKNRAEFPATVTFGDGSTMKGKLVLESGTMVYEEPGSRKKAVLDVSDIALIEILSWKGKEYRKFSYVFWPREYRITLRDSSRVLVSRDITALFSFSFTGSGGSEKKLYTYFYDYWKKGKWVNAGSGDFRHHEKNPHPDTVVRIRFLVSAPSGNPADILQFILEQ